MTHSKNLNALKNLTLREIHIQDQKYLLRSIYVNIQFQHVDNILKNSCSITYVNGKKLRVVVSRICVYHCIFF